MNGVEDSDAAPQSGVLIIGNFLSAADRSRGVCEELTPRLRQLGWRVVTASDRPGRLARLLDMLWTAASARREYRIALVDVYSGPSFLWAEAVACLLSVLRKPYLLVLHGGNLPAFERRYPRRVARLLRRAARVVTPSGYLAEALAHVRGDIAIIPNGVDTATLRVSEGRREPRRVLWLRAFHRIYEPALVPRIVALLPPQFADVRVWMIGPDRDDGSLHETRDLAASLGVADRVEILGPIEKREVPDWMSRAALFLNTSTIDNTPVSVVEAMAAGLCVVTTNAGGIPYLVQHGVEGLLFPVGNASAAANAMALALSDPDASAGMTAAARRKARLLDWGPVTHEWDRLFRSVLAPSRAREINAT